MKTNVQWLRARKAADDGLEKYRLTWKKEQRGVRDCLADEIVKLLQFKNIKLDWFFVDMFLELAQDKKNKNGVRLQKKCVTFSYNNEQFTVTFERGDKLNDPSR